MNWRVEWLRWSGEVIQWLKILKGLIMIFRHDLIKPSQIFVYSIIYETSGTEFKKEERNTTNISVNISSLISLYLVSIWEVKVGVILTKYLIVHMLRQVIFCYAIFAQNCTHLSLYLHCLMTFLPVYLCRDSFLSIQ